MAPLRLLARRSFTTTLGTLAATVLALAACGPSRGGGGDDDPADPDADLSCSPGTRRCAGATLQTCVDGRFEDAQTCPMACDDRLGCVVCVPGTGTCNGDTSSTCKPDGSGYEEVHCDPVQGMSCGPSGTCEGACSPAALGDTYFGCEYRPTVTGNPVANTFNFAVVVANTSGQAANVTVEGGALTAPRQFTVPAGAAVVHHLPWQSALKLCDSPILNNCIPANRPYSARADGGAYRLRTDVPVTVYQFSPIEYTRQGQSSYTNDASLLFPISARGATSTTS